MVNKEIINQFLVWLRAGHSGATVSSYFWALRQLEVWLDLTRKEVLKLTVSDFANFLLWLENRGLHSGTRYHYITATRSLWHWLHQQGLVPYSEGLIPIPNRYDVKSHECLTPDEFLRMINYFDEFFPKDLRDKTIISLLFATGVRIGELLSINADDINLTKKMAEIKTFKRKNHRRQIFWDEMTNDILYRWLDVRQKMLEREHVEAGALFIALDANNYGNRISPCAVQRLFRRLRVKCGIDKKITPHSCRHGFATLGSKNNINLVYLQKILGHASIRSTQIYIHPEDKDIEREYHKIYGSSNFRQGLLIKI